MTLSVLWFILIAVLWIGYLTLEGFGFGVGMIYKFVAKDERERRALLGTIGPHWDGNEVWLLTAGGATFAAFPEWYGTLFSGAYLVLFLILLALIVRVCAIEWRGKINSDTWRARWDWAHTISAWLPAILWGAAFANLVQGMQIEVVEVASRKVVPVSEALAAQSAGTLIPGASHEITGGFWSLITPFTLLGGLVTCSLFLTHGALFAALDADHKPVQATKEQWVEVFTRFYGDDGLGVTVNAENIEKVATALSDNNGIMVNLEDEKTIEKLASPMDRLAYGGDFTTMQALAHERAGLFEGKWNAEFAPARVREVLEADVETQAEAPVIAMEDTVAREIAEETIGRRKSTLWAVPVRSKTGTVSVSRGTTAQYRVPAPVAVENEDDGFEL